MDKDFSKHFRGFVARSSRKCRDALLEDLECDADNTSFKRQDSATISINRPILSHIKIDFEAM
jgi:hypothetical protein